MLDDIKTKIFADGADLEGILSLAKEPYIKGFTTNPTLMRKAGITDYAAFARDLLEKIPGYPISFEVFADEPEEMHRQAKLLASWGEDVYVKVPVTNTEGQSMAPLVKELASEGVKVNVTAVFTQQQVEEITEALVGGPASCVSVFAGRIADAGKDPVPLVKEALATLKAAPQAEMIWASPREVLNLVQADQVGCHIITMTHDLLAKLKSLGKDLDQFSLETVKMFYNDAKSAGYSI